MDIVCRYEIQEQKEVPAWYTGIYTGPPGDFIPATQSEGLPSHQIHLKGGGGVR
jgi:hypothetical protein